MRKNSETMNVAMNVKKFFRRITKLFTKSSSNSNSTSREVDLEQIAAQEQKHFSYETLSRATDNFNLDRKLGEGGFGPVYKGKLDDGREIAVKKLSRTSRQGKTEFQNEARLLTRIQHRNVVNLLGYCASGGEKLLVYEYVHHESLDKLLFNPNRRGELDWKKRFDVICGVAKGLHYLHEDAHKRIIHRDIKASNILLDQKWAPKIADFGMARLFSDDTSRVNTRVVGTNGYMAPEYLLHGDLSVKVDVFSYGVLILELVSGQRNSSFDPNLGAENLPDWAYKMHKKKSSQKIMDPILEATAVEQQVVLCAHIGLLCTQSNPSLRPTMHRVRLLLSKPPSSLEEPTRPAGFTGSRYRRPRKPRASSSNASSSRSSFISSVGTTAISKASTSTAASTELRLTDSRMRIK